MSAPGTLPPVATSGAVGVLPEAVPAAGLGESPLWHPVEQCLYWIDIPGRQLHRHDPARGAHQQWPLPSETGCCAAALGGGLLLAARDGLWQFDTRRGTRRLLDKPPYDPSRQRFNDGKPDALGRFWVGTIDDARRPEAALYCWQRGRAAGRGFQKLAAGIANSNGLAVADDGRSLFWADTAGHQVIAFDLDLAEGSLSRRRVLQRFAPRDAAQPLSAYGGRPDGAAIDAEGCYWVAMYEGQRLLRLAPDGQLLGELALPVRCPTMPCFGGPDLRTLYITTARAGRPDDELQAQPWAGRVLQLRVPVPGLPAHLVRC